MILEWILVAVLIFVVLFLLAGIRIIRPTHRGIVETLGKFTSIREPGFNFVVPIFQRMIFVNITERMTDIEPQIVITKDNLNCKVDLVIYFRVKKDSKEVMKAVYEVNDLDMQLETLARTTARNVIGTLMFKDVNSERNELNKRLQIILSKETQNWGVEVLKVELKDVVPPEDVQETMNKVIKASNEKEAAVDFACYSQDTRVLTENGFKYHEEVLSNEKIMCYDTKTNKISLMKHKGLSEFDVEGDLINFSSQNQDFLVTPNHKIFFSTGDKWGVQKAEEIKDYSKIIVKNTANWDSNQELKKIKLLNKEIKSDLFLEFAGYYLADGTVCPGDLENNRFVRFGLKKKEKILNLKDCLNKIGWKYHQYTDEYGQTKITICGKELQNYLYNNFGGYSNEKKIPRNILNLSKKQLNILFEAIMWDGSIDERENRTAMSYCSSSKGLAENVQEIALKLGYSTKLVEEKGSGFNPGLKYYRVLISEKGNKHINTILVEKYAGKVYCFSTPTGFYVTERNGCIAIQGNTAQETQADGVKRAAIKEAEGRKQAQILEAEGLRQSKILVAAGEAERIRLVYQSANKHFIKNAKDLKRLEVTQASLENNAKVVLTEKGISPSIILGDLPIQNK